MALQSWHVGKLAILWAWGTIITGLFLKGVNAVNEDTLWGLTVGFLLLVAIAGIPISLTVITWKWFSARENE